MNAADSARRDDSPEQALYLWVRRKTGDALLARAAAAAVRAEAAGHACAWLAEEGFDAAQMHALHASPWVSTALDDAPFVLDTAGRFYVRRNAAAEQGVADALRARAAPERVAPPDGGALLAQLLPGVTSGEQRAALARGLDRRLFVLTGGPGTGKTTSLLALLLTLLRLGPAAGLPLASRVALAAPTGRAAARMQQALQGGLHRLRSCDDGHAALDMAWTPALQALAGTQASTLHRLLGRRLHGDDALLPADIVAVDEASMVDLGLMRTLLASLHDDALLVLLGDPDQLASVEAGSVLADIVAAAVPGSALGACVARLEHSHRAGTALVQVLRAVCAGDADALLAAQNEVFLRRDVRTAADARAALQAWLTGPGAVLLRLTQPGLDPRQALALLAQSQLLCALRAGPFGETAVNAAVEAWLRRRRALPAGFWYPGRTVMVTCNDPDTRLHNGDIGVALAGPSGTLAVWFEGHDDAGGSAPRALPPHLLPEHVPAYAITIHKSQGSEYDSVGVLLPSDPDSPILSRELVYTALSRARRHAELWCTEAALAAALARPIRRAGGLRERLLAAARQAAFQ